jgi:hypothetical protein
MTLLPGLGSLQNRMVWRPSPIPRHANGRYRREHADERRAAIARLVAYWRGKVPPHH